MKLAVLMDPLDSLKPYKDTTIGMIRAAQARGWSTVFFTLKDMACCSGRPQAQVYSIKIGDVQSPDWFEVQAEGEKPLDSFDILLMRKDPPFDLEYIYATYALDLAEKAGVLVANKPSSLRDANEKFFTLNFPQCSTPTLVTKDIQRLRAFWEEHRNVIFKPLAGMGGASVFHVNSDGKNLSVILEVLTHFETLSIMAQCYIPDIESSGDKRIILINGEPIAYALARIPKKGELRGNLAAGAKGRVVSLSERDYFICSQVAPVLREKGLYFVGIDVIGDYLTEINVTSPTCAIEIEAETGLDITGEYLDFLAELHSST